jgi:LysM repeat protein
VTHEVLPKQTLYSLSRQYGVSVDELIANNPESKSGLTVGMLLKIPVKTPQVTKQTVKAAAPTPPVVTKPAPKVEKEEKAEAPKRTHVVQRKETLYSISRQYDISVEELTRANNITSIKVGQELIIPMPQKQEQTETTIEEPSIKVVENPTMAVKKGDLDLINKPIRIITIAHKLMSGSLRRTCIQQWSACI